MKKTLLALALVSVTSCSTTRKQTQLSDVLPLDTSSRTTPKNPAVSAPQPLAPTTNPPFLSTTPNANSSVLPPLLPNSQVANPAPQGNTPPAANGRLRTPEMLNQLPSEKDYQAAPKPDSNKVIIVTPPNAKNAR